MCLITTRICCFCRLTLRPQAEKRFREKFRPFPGTPFGRPSCRGLSLASLNEGRQWAGHLTVSSPEERRGPVMRFSFARTTRQPPRTEQDNAQLACTLWNESSTKTLRYALLRPGSGCQKESPSEYPLPGRRIPRRARAGTAAGKFAFPSTSCPESRSSRLPKDATARALAYSRTPR